MTGRLDTQRRRQVTARVPAIIVGVTLLMAVLVVDPGTLQVFGAPKWLILCLGVPVAFAATAATGPVRAAPIGRPLLAIVAVVVLATVFGIAPALSFWGAPFRFAGAVTWMLWAVVAVVGATLAGRDPRLRLRFADILAVAMVVQAVVAGLQRAGIDPFDIESDLDRSRAWGTLGNASVLGALSAFALPVLVGTAGPGTTGLRRGGALAAIITLALAGSRGAALGGLVGLVVLAVARRDLRRPAAAAGVVLVIGVLVVPGTSERVVGGSELASATASGRLELWERSLPLVVDRPLLGSGPETFRIRFPAEADESFVRQAGDDRIRDRAHNLILDTLVTSGIAGLAALVWLGVVVVRRRDRDDPATLALAAGLAAYVVVLQFHFSDPTVDALVWFALGLTTAAPAPDGAPTRRGPSLAVAGASVAGALVLGGLAARDAVADRRLHDGLGDGSAAGVASAAELAPDRLLYVQSASRASLAAGDPPPRCASPTTPSTSLPAIPSSSPIGLERSRRPRSLRASRRRRSTHGRPCCTPHPLLVGRGCSTASCSPRAIASTTPVTRGARGAAPSGRPGSTSQPGAPRRARRTVRRRRPVVARGAATASRRPRGARCDRAPRLEPAASYRFPRSSLTSSSLSAKASTTSTHGMPSASMVRQAMTSAGDPSRCSAVR